MYRIRKYKVWKFLLWLKQHNKLYRDIWLDEETMNLYPDDGYLPDIEHSIIHDNRSDREDMFKEETAGISEHPAELFSSSSNEPRTESPQTMIEKSGVMDPECDRVPGLLHRGSAAVPEYNNPDLIPGMYPTLFPFGVGGFDIPNRVCPISFSNQAKYCLDLADSVAQVIYKLILLFVAHGLSLSRQNSSR